MPFINDQLTQNKDTIAKQLDQKNNARASRFRFDPAQVLELLKARIVGQDAVLSALEDVLVTIKADFGSRLRPLTVIFFLGPTGVGKTETVRVITEAILGDPNKLCRIDMNTLGQEHYSAALTGSPPGYVGSKEGQSLFDLDNIKGSFSKPGIVLFDEIEKADKNVVRAIMNVFDTGKLTLTSGAKEIDFSNTLIFMTSNIGVKEMTQYRASYQKGWRKWLGLTPISEPGILDRALHKHFDLEFINRIDRIIQFNSLDTTLLDELLSIEINKLNKRLKRQHASLALNLDARRFLCGNYDEQFGARAINRRIRVEVEPKLAHALTNFADQTDFIATMNNNDLVITPNHNK